MDVGGPSIYVDLSQVFFVRRNNLSSLKQHGFDSVIQID